MENMNTRYMRMSQIEKKVLKERKQAVKNLTKAIILIEASTNLVSSVAAKSYNEIIETLKFERMMQGAH